MVAVIFAGFFALYVTHFAVRAGVGNWAPTVMEHRPGLESSTFVLVISALVLLSGVVLMILIARARRDERGSPARGLSVATGGT